MYPWGDMESRRLWSIRVTNLQNRFYERLKTANRIYGSFVAGLFQDSGKRETGTLDNVHVAPAFVGQNPYSGGITDELEIFELASKL